MQELDDNALLREYAEHGSEEAFTTLVARHINKVYSVALRHTGNPSHAEEITQAVFVILATKCRRLHAAVVLSGWLYQTARLTSVTFLRSEIRRTRREQEAYMQRAQNENEPDLWRQIAPLLDVGMARLSEKERHAIVLRFFDGKSMREVGAALGANENAAKKRVGRALEKLRNFFTKRGVSSTTILIGEAISAHSVQAAPAVLAKSVSAVAVAKGAAASASTLTLIKGALKIMAWTKAKTTIVGAVIAGAAMYSVIQHRAASKLRDENQSLRHRVAQMESDNARLVAKQRAPLPQLPAPQIQVAAAVTNVLSEESAESTNLYARLKDKHPRLSPEQVEAYLKTNGRTAASLLAAFRTSGDTAMLKEAMEKFPNDPQVAFEAVLDKDLSPAEQRQWLDAFKKSAPNNAMANYLSALNYFNSGQTDQAVQELSAAAGKPLEDYTISRMQNDEEAYIAAGHSISDATDLALWEIMLPQVSQLEHLGYNTVDLAKAYNQAGDPASAQAALQIAVDLGRQYADPSPGKTEISQLVGLAIEEKALQSMDPNSSYGGGAQTVQDLLDGLAQQRASIKGLSRQATDLFSTMSDQDWIIYKERFTAFGGLAADQWVINKYGQQ